MLVCLGLVAVSSGPAVGAERITRGDAQAALQAYWNAGFTIDAKGNTAAPPVGPDRHYTILSYFHEDTRICTTNWHAFGLGSFVEGTVKDAVADMSLLDLSFAIDGVPVESKISAIKRVTAFGGVIFAWTQGGLIEPGSLSIGAHQFTTYYDYAGTLEVLTVTFFVDAEGTGSCL